MIAALAPLAFAFAGVVTIASLADSAIRARRIYRALIEERTH
jgi:hypothetical protein